ncbi:MAG: hypothetical protein V3V95_05775, partial [Thermodesulfobacteriota bacterium]
MDRRRSFIIVLIAFAFLLCVFLFKPLFLGYSLWPADSIYSIPPWNLSAPEGYTGPSNHLLFDNVFLFYPFFSIVADILRSGELPLWNPYFSCGWPLAANSIGFFFPINFLFYILPLWYAFGLVSFIKLFLAGVFTYLFLTGLRLRPFAAFIGAVSFIFSGFMVAWMGHPHTNIALLLPVMLFLIDRLFKLEGRASLTGAVLFAIAVACAFLGGHYETTFHLLSAVGLF